MEKSKKSDESKERLYCVQDQRPFLMIYHDCMDSDLLETPYQKIVYFYLKRFANEKNQCFPSMATLTKRTKMSMKTLKKTLKELEEKGVLKREKRFHENGGNSSNLYTLYDFAQLWKANDTSEVETIMDEITIEQKIKELEALGYSVQKCESTKEKKPVMNLGNSLQAHTATDHNSDSIHSYSHNDTKEKEKSQVCRNKKNNEDLEYSLEQIKTMFHYEVCLQMAKQCQGICEADILVAFEILFEVFNSTKKTIRISSQNRDIATVKKKLSKLSYDHIIYALQKYNERDNRIVNPKSYLLTLLYTAEEQMYLDINNQVKCDQKKYIQENSSNQLKEQKDNEWL